MALQRPISKALTCSNCQTWILKSFIASIGGTVTFRPPPTSSRLQRRPYSRTTRGLNEARERIQVADNEEHALNDINDEVARNSDQNPEHEATKPAQEHVPWYLQVQPPIQRTENPLAACQRLPNLPDHPPQILQPLLEHVSIELGMDDMSLLDLRSLDPPPALGANLLMIVGTARSEKHLHVSADRLCRWLRTQYKLSPYADGLLGRNELKLKMRRKAKRTRLLSAVGAKATADTEIDDGIRTGWVCVNVGRVEGGELPEQEETSQKTDEIVGFGAKSGGSNIVVQMMTEEKRGEIDLENLWTGIMNKARRKHEPNVEGSAPLARHEEGTPSTQYQDLPASAAYLAEMPVSNHTAGQQVRAYHMATRRRQAMANTLSATSSDILTKRGSILHATTDTADPAANTLANMLLELKLMDPKHALEVLGEDLIAASERAGLGAPVSDVQLGKETGVSDSSFLNDFYGAMPSFPGPKHWHCHIQLLAYARRLGHVRAHARMLIAQLTNMQIAGLIPEERTFKLVVQAVLTPMGKLKPLNGTYKQPNYGRMHRVLAVLEDMEACGYDPVSPDILEMLHLAWVGPPQPQRTFELGTVLQSLKAASLRRHARENDWPSFWRTWRSYPQRFLPRTAEMYEVLFNSIGTGGLEDTREAIDILRTYLPEMEREEPPVVLNENSKVAEAAMRALERIEPKLKDPVRADSVNKEWKGWYERCLGVLDGTR